MEIFIAYTFAQVVHKYSEPHKGLVCNRQLQAETNVPLVVLNIFVVQYTMRE